LHKIQSLKKLVFIIALFLHFFASAQKNVSINFVNEYADVYHLALSIYTPDGKNETRVSDIKPYTTKTYTYPPKTEIYIANYSQEAAAMKGTDLKSSGLKPYIVLDAKDEEVTILLSTVNNK
jgi:hypothetical protein